MIARRQKHLKLGLLPRMDVRGPRRDGTYSYRYKRHDGTYIALGEDERGVPLSGLHEAKRRALDLIEGRPLSGTFSALAAEWMRSPAFQRLAPRTKDDYRRDLERFGRVFGKVRPEHIKPSHIARYLRVERAEAPVRGNREVFGSVSSVFNYGIELYDLPRNPTRGVRPNPETPRSNLPEARDIDLMVECAKGLGRGYHMIALTSLLTAVAGQRRQDVLRLRRPAEGDASLRVVPLKRKWNETPVTIEIPITPGVRRIVDAAIELMRGRRDGTVFLFPSRTGLPYSDTGAKAMAARIQDAVVAAGGKRFTVTDLRAYYVSSGMALGLRVTEATGHKTDRMVRQVYDRRRVRKAEPLE